MLVGTGLVLILLAGIYWDNQTGGRFKSELTYAISGEPSYEGKTINYWLDHWYQEYGKPNLEAHEAIIAMGAKAAPWLGAQMEKRTGAYFDSPTFRYCGRLLQAFEILGPEGKPAIPYLIKSLGNDMDYSERALLFIGPAAAPPLAQRLLETLADTNNPFYFGGTRMNIRKASGYFVRGRILSVFDRMGTNAEVALPALVFAASTNLPVYSAGMYQQNLYTTLARVGLNSPKVAAPVLLRKFAELEAERGKIAQAMALFGTQQANIFMSTLIAGLSDVKTDGPSRIQIGQAITNISGRFDKELVPVFVDALTDSSSPEPVRCSMAGYLATVGLSQPEIVVPALRTAYTNATLSGRSSIARALAHFPQHSQSMVPLMLEDCSRTAEPPSDNHWRIDLTFAVRAIAPHFPGTLSALLNDLNDPSAYIRQQTIYALGKLGTNGSEAIPPLITCMSHTDTQTRIDAVSALNEIGAKSDAYISALASSLSCTNRFLTQQSRSTLANLASARKPAFVALINMIAGNGGDRDDRRQVRYALDNISTKDPSFMLECLEDPDAQIRSGALTVFDDLTCHVPQGISRLRELANGDRDSIVRIKAAEVLKRQLQ